jgi:hypothetical protein
VLLIGLGLAVSGCEVQSRFTANCALFPQTPHGPSTSPGGVDARADVPLSVVPGEEFTIRILDIGGDPDLVQMAHAGGIVSVTGAVQPSQTYTVTQLGQEITVTATGAPGDQILLRVRSGWALFSTEPLAGATCTVFGDDVLRSIPIVEPEPGS